jgi:creatinine amidohydrolase
VKGAWIEDLAWPEVRERLKVKWPVIIPIGARSKEHGHHLPMKTDYLLARALCDGIAERLRVLVAPVVDFGYYPAFANYPGSQHLRAETFIALLDDILDRLLEQGAARIAIVNTGVSTEGPVQIAVRNILSRRGVEVPVADIRRLGKASAQVLQQKFGGHGDEHETSLMLAIAPESVDMSKAMTDYGHLATEPETVFYRPVAFSGDDANGINYSATGVRGDPTLATAEKGRIILDDMIGELVQGLEALCPDMTP